MNRLQEVVQKFRSGSVDTDKSSSFSLSGEDSGARSRSLSATEGDDGKDSPMPTPRTLSGDSVWVTSGSHSSVYTPPLAMAHDTPTVAGSRTQGHSLGFLSDLSLHSTPLVHGTTASTTSGTSGTSLGTTAGSAAHSLGPAARPKEKPPVSVSTMLSAQQLQDSVLSALRQSTRHISEITGSSSSSSSMGRDDGDGGGGGGGGGQGGGRSAAPKKLPVEKRLSKQKPKGTFEYTVKDRDTLVKIGAQFEVTPSELMRINKMLSRTVFAGQTLYIPDPDYVPSEPTTPMVSPNPEARPTPDFPLVSLSDKSKPSVPGHAVQVTATKTSVGVTSPTSSTGASAASANALPARRHSDEEDESDRECLQKFLKMPVRRIMEDEEYSGDSQGFMIKGTLLVTPNAIMFDPDVNDQVVIDSDGQLKFSMVVYMEEIKGVALFNDYHFFKLPKEVRACSPRPEAYRSGQGARPKVEGQDETDCEVQSVSSHAARDNTRLAPDGASVSGEGGQQRVSPDGGELTEDGKGQTTTGRTSEELEKMAEMSEGNSDTTSQTGRVSKEVENALTRSQGFTPTSPLIRQMSRSSELAVSEISLIQEGSEVFGETRDFGQHMSRSASEALRQTSSSLGRASESSPGDVAGRSFFTDRTDSGSDILSTPTQGFAPVHFTDRSPRGVTAHPKPVPGQRVMSLSQSPVLGATSNLKSEENRIVEDAAEVEAGEVMAGGVVNECTSTEIQRPPQGEDNSSNTKDLSATGGAVEPSSAEDDSDKTLVADDGDQSSQSLDTTSPKSEALVAKATSDSKTVAPSTSASASRRSQAATLAPSQTEVKGEDEVAKLASQVSDLDLDSTDSGKDKDEELSKSSDTSSLSSFSPLRAPAQHLSSFFNYTSNLLRGGLSDKEKSSSVPATPTATGVTASSAAAAKTRGRHKSATLSPSSSSSGIALQLKSGFTKEEMTKVLGPDPKHFLPRSDSPHFEKPLYLQIRPGIQKGKQIFQPRAFDHRKIAKLLEEYWFCVPRDMGDKLYNFLMEWQPDAYGDHEETRPRETFFYDPREVRNLIQPVRRGRTRGDSAGGDGIFEDLEVSENHFADVDKSWEILSKDETYEAEREQALNRQDTIDEANLPELVGGRTQILEPYHILCLLRAIPRNMSAGYNWELVYATHQHGYSLQNLYTKMENLECDSPVLLLIKDAHRNVFGAFLSNNIKTSDTFYGSGATFLFTFYPEFRKFAWQGDNQFFMNGTRDSFAIGAGEGLFGLWLDGDLNRGRSHECTTFHNDLLTKEEDFAILDLEVWRFIDSSLI